MSLRGSAVVTAASVPAAVTRSHVRFSVAGVEYAVDARQVRHALRAPARLGPDVLFLEKRYRTVDLRTLFRLPPSSERHRLMLMVESEGVRAALLVDSIAGLVSIEEAAITPLPRTFAGGERRWFLGVARVEASLVVVARVEGLLEPRDRRGSSPARTPVPLVAV